VHGSPYDQANSGWERYVGLAQIQPDSTGTLVSLLK